ncbi:MAG: PilT/PilU family type 4a pilus ATPase [Dehalococcoidales bacterium]|nr:PilT/PilU family type 4a pilus ATPase [Dehalococcoidales bacterium]
MEVNELLKIMVDKNASDMHLRVPSPPVLRIDGVLITQEDLSPLDSKDIEMAFERIATPTQRSIFLKEKELDFAYSVSGLARFRVNVMRQRGTVSIAFRMVPFDILSIDDLEIPQPLKDLLLKPYGLILITGPAGSGKSTTMAALVHHVNQNEKRNIITIEDTIEYLHSNKKSIIAQRDIGDDTQSFAIALKHALRHDPDIIVVGEMRDPDTVSNAIRVAETGRLVIGILNANDTIQAIDHIFEVFPEDKQQQIRMQLSRVLEAVLSQKLVTRITGGRIAVFEILMVDNKVKKLIRESKTIQFSDNGNMQGMDKALVELVQKGVILQDEALSKSLNPEMLRDMLQTVPKKAEVKS